MNRNKGDRRTAVCAWGVVVLVILTGVTAAAGASAAERTWGLGWDEGLTVRYLAAGTWEFALAAGPDDYLQKIERRSSELFDPVAWHGVLEVPSDYREEQGWVRGQIGRRLATRGNLALTAFTGLTYNWIDAQERILVLDDLVGDFDTWERDRFTERWILAAGLRPSWRPADFLTVEFAFGLRFIWESWSETSERTYAGVDGADHEELSSHGRAFGDFGWEGVSSLQFFFWF